MERDTEHLSSEVELRAEVAENSKKLGNSLDSSRVMSQAIRESQRLLQTTDFHAQMNNALTRVIVARASLGDFESALKDVPLLSTNKTKANGYAQIAKIQGETGDDPTTALELALKSAKEIRPGYGGRRDKMYADKADIYETIATTQADLGRFKEARETVSLIHEGFTQERENLLKIIQDKEDTGVMPTDRIENSEEEEVINKDELHQQIVEASQVQDAGDKARQLADLARKQAKIGEDVTSTLAEVQASIKHVSNRFEVQYIYEELAKAQAEAGLLDQALDSVNHVSDTNKVSVLIDIATLVGKKGFTAKQIKELPQNIVEMIVSKGTNTSALEALGYFGGVDVQNISDVPAHSRVSLLAGAAEQSKDQELINEARKIAAEEENLLVTRAFVESVVATQDYETASNNLLGLLDQLSQKPDSLAQTMRILKGLIETDNPKGKTMATRLFADEKLPPHYRAYIARKLIDCEYWDPKLALYLESGVDELPRNVHSKEDDEVFRQIFGDKHQTYDEQMEDIRNYKPNRPDQAAVLSALILNFGLTPDLPSYQLLEKQGVLRSQTLGERVFELKQKMHEFEGKSQYELLEMFKKDSNALKIFYVTKAGAYRYSIVNDYSLDKFRTVTSRVHDLEIHHQTMNGFEEVLNKGGIGKTEALDIVDDAYQGRPLIVGDERAIQFSTTVEYGSEYEAALQRLQEVWKEELKSLLLMKAAGRMPESVTECLTLLENHDQVAQLMPQIFRLARPLKLDQDKITPLDIEAISRDLRNRLQQVYKGNREQLQKLKGLPNSEVIYEYLKSNLPETAASSEWFGHLQDTLIQIETSQQQSGTKSVDKQLELTFLDKNEDFIRALRFADSAQCCFNASRENFRYRTYEYVTRLNKDPLSFMMDLKQVGSNEIQGFVFGRMGVNPETGKLVLMLNGIYSQLKGQTIVDNILQIIEEKMGGRLKPEMIVIASQYGGTIAQPKGYSSISKKLVAIRALAGQEEEQQTDEDAEMIALFGPTKKAEEKTYDDIGTIANGQFRFKGYGKVLSH